MPSTQSNRRWRTPCRSGATIVEMAVVLGLGLVLLAIGIVLLPWFGASRDGGRHIKDASQVRVILQGMQIAAANNQNLIPYPSTLHSGPPSESDTPAALLRRLLADGLFSSEWLVSPAEANESIRSFGDRGSAAGESSDHLELFAATPDDIPDRTIGHCSYAFTPPFGARRASLNTKVPATQAVVGNRGPSFEGGRTEPWTLFDAAQERATGRKGINSNTLLIHGGRRTWEGNIAYADGHVNFESQADPAELLWTFSGFPAKSRADQTICL
jgi:prepilin-type processing-associated H-X9-DG protein